MGVYRADDDSWLERRFSDIGDFVMGDSTPATNALGSVVGYLNRPDEQGPLNTQTGHRDPLPTVSQLRGTDLGTAIQENLTSSINRAGPGTNQLTSFPAVGAYSPAIGPSVAQLGSPASVTPWTGPGPSANQLASPVNTTSPTTGVGAGPGIDQLTSTPPPATNSWLETLSEMTPEARQELWDQHQGTVTPVKDEQVGSPSMWGPNAQMPDPADEGAWDAMIEGIEGEFGNADSIYNPVYGDGGGDPAGDPPGGDIVPDPPAGFQPATDLSTQIETILSKPDTPDYSDLIESLYADLREAAKGRAETRRGVLTVSKAHREGQITDIYDGLVEALGPIEADRIAIESGLVKEVSDRADQLVGDTSTRQTATRALLGAQVSDAYEVAAEIAAALAGSHSASSKDLMARLSQVAGIAAADRTAAPEMMKGDAMMALGDEQFRLVNQIETDLADTLADLGPQEAAALLEEKIRQGDFQTEEDMRIADALLNDLQRRNATTEAAWETHRQEAREDRLRQEGWDREDDLIEDQQTREDDLRTAEETEAAEAALAEERAVQEFNSTAVGILKNHGFSDEIIGPAMQYAGSVPFNHPNRDAELKAQLDLLQQSSATSGGPTPLSMFDRAKLESAIYIIWDEQMLADRGLTAEIIGGRGHQGGKKGSIGDGTGPLS